MPVAKVFCPGLIASDAEIHLLGRDQNSYSEDNYIGPMNYVTYFGDQKSSKRIMFLANTTENVNQDGWAKGFALNGYYVIKIDFSLLAKRIGKDDMEKFIIRQAAEFKPNWVHAQIQFAGLISPITIEGIRSSCNGNVVITSWSADLRNDAPSCFTEPGKHCDKVFLPGPGQMDMYRDAGLTNVSYCLPAFDPEYFYKMEDVPGWVRDKYESSVVFIANNWGFRFNFPGSELRMHVANQLAEHFKERFHIYGIGWQKVVPDYCIKGTVGYYEARYVYNCSKVAISVNNYNGVKLTYSNRLITALACGVPVVSSYFNGIEDKFIQGEGMRWGKSTDEIVARAVSFVENGANSSMHKRVLAEDSYQVRVKELESEVGLDG